MFTVPAAEGVSLNRVMCQAAQAEGIRVPDPHAELGTTQRLRELAGSLDLEAEDIQPAVWEEPEPLSDPAARERVRRRFITQAERHHPRQDLLLARFTLPTPA